MVEVVLLQHSLEDNSYNKKSEVLFTFTPNKSYFYLLNIEPIILLFLKAYNIESDYIIIIFTYQTVGRQW